MCFFCFPNELIRLLKITFHLTHPPANNKSDQGLPLHLMSLMEFLEGQLVQGLKSLKVVVYIFICQFCHPCPIVLNLALNLQHTTYRSLQVVFVSPPPKPSFHQSPMGRQGELSNFLTHVTLSPKIIMLTAAPYSKYVDAKSSYSSRALSPVDPSGAVGILTVKVIQTFENLKYAWWCAMSYEQIILPLHRS